MFTIHGNTEQQLLNNYVLRSNPKSAQQCVLYNRKNL